MEDIKPWLPTFFTFKIQQILLKNSFFEKMILKAFMKFQRAQKGKIILKEKKSSICNTTLS